MSADSDIIFIDQTDSIVLCDLPKLPVVIRKNYESCNIFLGEGTFGSVQLVKRKLDQVEMAARIIKKDYYCGDFIKINKLSS